MSSIDFRKKFLEWRNQNIYEVSQSLKKEFEFIKVVDHELKEAYSFQNNILDSLKSSNYSKELDIEALFSHFEDLISDNNKKGLSSFKYSKKKTLLNNSIAQDIILEEEDNYSQTSSQIHKDVQKLENFIEQEKNTVVEESESENVIQGNLSDSFDVNISEEDNKIENDSFKISNNQYSTPKSNNKQIPSLLEKMYQSQVDKMSSNYQSHLGMSFGPNQNFTVKDKSYSNINDTISNSTKNRTVDDLQEDLFGRNFNSITNESFSKQKELKILDSKENSFNKLSSVDENIQSDKNISNQLRDTIQSQQKQTAMKNKRVLELHYNLLFALTNYSKKIDKEGYNSLQEEIMCQYSTKTFENLIYFIESKMDFKKIVNLICLINFTNHGLHKDEYDEIILKVIENYPIKNLYILLKMDSFGFFSIKKDIFGVSNKSIENKKQQLLSNKAKSGISFSKANLDQNEQKILDFNKDINLKVFI